VRQSIGMNEDGIYRSEKGARRIKWFYDELLSELNADFERRWVDTRFGETHVLVTGPSNAPPLVVFHGGNVVNPISLEWFLSLADEFRIYAPDTIGHPGYSAQTRVSPRDESYGVWAVDVLDSLGIEETAMIGPSYGGGILLRTAAYAPERITRAGLVVPAGFGNGSLRRMILKIFLPMLMYRLAPRRDRLERSVQPMFSEPVADINSTILDVIGTVFKEVKLERSFPKTVTASELEGFDAPTLLAVADEDVFFPPDVVVPHAKATIDSLEIVVRLRGESHFPAPNARRQLRTHLREFLTNDS
jgi:pimeloyl-ACP methyl ester carboxylesterase